MVLWSHFLAGTWYPSTGITVLKDINGTVLSVGDTVKIEGTIVAFAPASPTLGFAVVQVKYGPPKTLSASTLNLIRE
jgi:hypothetical protein